MRDITPPLSPDDSSPHTFWRRGASLGTAGRWLAALAGLFLVVGFGLAASVAPDPRGFGTHQRFGLPPCTFLSFFNLPCPSCGMTTCFAHFVRGQWAASARANPAGLLLAVVCSLLVPWCGISAAVGRWWMVRRPEPALLTLALTVVGAALIHWILRIAIS